MQSGYLFHYTIPFLGAFLGMAIAYWVKPKSPKGLKLILSFSGAFLLGITIFHLLPDVFEKSSNDIGIWIVAGLVLQILLEFLSQGAEHGHTHTHLDSKIPWTLFVSLCVHAFIEGTPMGEQKALVWGIFVHKIPIGIVLFLMIWQLKVSNKVKVSCLFLFALMSPAGSFLASNFGAIHHWKTALTALVVGMLFHISTTILFESNQGHAFNVRKLAIILAGFVLSYFI
jgi:hypothetical protein